MKKFSRELKRQLFYDDLTYLAYKYDFSKIEREHPEAFRILEEVFIDEWKEKACPEE